LFFFQAEDGIRDYKVTGVQTCALPISGDRGSERRDSARRCRGRPHRAGCARRGLHPRARARGRAGGEQMGCGGQGSSREGKERRSEERRVGKEWRSRWWASPDKKTTDE